MCRFYYVIIKYVVRSQTMPTLLSACQQVPDRSQQESLRIYLAHSSSSNYVYIQIYALEINRLLQTSKIHLGTQEVSKLLRNVEDGTGKKATKVPTGPELS